MKMMCIIGQFIVDKETEDKSDIDAQLLKQESKRR